jgi:hypothetical protein
MKNVEGDVVHRGRFSATREIHAYEWRCSPVEQAGREAIVLHESEPARVVLRPRNRGMKRGRAKEKPRYKLVLI